MILSHSFIQQPIETDYAHANYNIMYNSLSVVTMLTVGLAQLCIVTSAMTITRARIEQQIPRKRRGSCANHDKVSQGK